MCDDCGWEDYEAVAEELAEKGSDYAESLLADWFTHNEHVTEPQKEALERVAKSFGIEL